MTAPSWSVPARTDAAPASRPDGAGPPDPSGLRNQPNPTSPGDSKDSKRASRGSGSAPRDPDLSRQSRTIRPLAVALTLLAGLSFLFWLANRNEPQLVITIALVLAVALDAVVSHLALRDPRIEVHNPVDGVVGQELTYHVRMPGLRRPLLVQPPGTWGFARSQPVVIDSSEPGALTLNAPPRGVVRYLVFDFTARGPLGLFENTRRRRVWLRTPMYIGPPPVEHDIDWSILRSVRLGFTEHAPQGDDLFRGIRPYVRGDTPRSVHWPSTARHQGLMVKESDGSGILALRVVVDLGQPGVAAEWAVSRASWLAEEGLRRGWVVHLVTSQAAGEPERPPPLRSAKGPLPMPAPMAQGSLTVDRRVRTPRDILRQLAVAGYGRPDLERWGGITRVITPWGDEWL